MPKKSTLLTKSFLIITFFYFTSFWFFSFWVLKNHGTVWSTGLIHAHNPFKLSLLDTNFLETITYLYAQIPLYALVSWLALKINQADHGFYSFIIMHFVMGFFALISLYKIFLYLNIRKWLITLSLSYFVFNPAFYLAFTSGSYDFLSMCLVSIMAYQFVRLIKEYNRSHLLCFIASLTVLVMYRSVFHPIFFFVPVVIMLTLIYRQHWRTILFYSVIPFILVMAPYVKNYLIFDKFDVAPGSFGLSIRSSTYQYKPAEELLNEIEKGHLSPLVLCYRRITQPVIYQGQVYSKENCKQYILNQFAAPKVKELLARKPYLAVPEILQDKNNPDFGNNFIPNSLTGYVIAKQISEDGISYIKHHPRDYVESILNNLRQLFRTNTTFTYLISDNVRNYPLWFGSRIFSLDFLKFNAPADLKKYGPFDSSYRPHILIGMLCAFTYALLFSANIKRRYLFSLMHFLGMVVILFPAIARHTGLHLQVLLGKSLLWSLIFILPSMLISLRVNLSKPLMQCDQEKRLRLVVAFLVFVCLYFITLTVLIPGGEQERYRFVVEGLIMSLFLFWVKEVARMSVFLIRGNPRFMRIYSQILNPG